MLGEQIKKLRLAKQVSQVEMANRIGVFKQSISNWENNNILPSIEMLVKMAEYFGCTSDYLLELDTDKVLIETTNLDQRQAAHIINIIRDYEELNRLNNKKKDH